jgi:superfamily II DNA or RNA helicase
MRVFEHQRFGHGTLLAEANGLYVIQFPTGIQACTPGTVRELQAAAAPAVWSPALPTIAKALALAIRSVNDQWGVFSASRIALLPHQLWVCKRVLEKEPSRWLVADDVGLGKTIEAGLIISALRGAGRLGRFLIIAPASLCAQWQSRLLSQFDIRTTIYDPRNDTPSSHFWEQHQAVIASLHTLRDDRGGRHERVMGVAWDLLIVDEAHHVHADERGWTKAYRLLHSVVTNARARSVLFFTGTPHRGKDHDFLSLLQLLRPDSFGPNLDIDAQLMNLSDVMIRNNKATVTDMKGQKLFVPTIVRSISWSHSEHEALFYERLSRYIAEGRTFASGLSGSSRNTAMLVLVAIQKLASSSVAAVRRALAKRLVRARRAEAARDVASHELDALPPAELASEAEEQRRRALEEMLVEAHLLGANEVDAIEELLQQAGLIARESRIDCILELLDKELHGRSVLFFTEYKATQALLLGALRERYGEASATFINGDGALELEVDRGILCRLQSERAQAASLFNAGKVRFLVSTEAAGEGIDLQAACHTLVHVDIPWNPMRMHQRVGRLNRYGQTKPVEIFTLQNPETVEGRIYDLLQKKLLRITTAMKAAMAEPEDMMQLVLGLESPSFFEDLYGAAPRDLEGVNAWFDARTSTFAGQSAVRVVKALVGHVARFDFQTAVDDLPQLDLPDLLPLMKALLVLNRREFTGDASGLSFITPASWRAWGIREDYREDRALIFDRAFARATGGTLAGVGFQLVDRAIAEALAFDVVATRVDGLPGPLIVVAVDDMETGSRVGPLQVVVGVELLEGRWTVLRDETLIRRLNGLLTHPRSPALATPPPPPDNDIAGAVSAAQATVGAALPDLRVQFTTPRVQARLVFWPPMVAHSA